MLSSILSPPAAELYSRLIDGETVNAGAGSEHDPAIAGSPAYELVAKGLAALSDRGATVLVPVEPATAHTALLTGIMAKLEGLQRQLTDSYDEFHHIHSRFVSRESEVGPALVNLITDPNQVVLLSDKMIAGATEEVVAFNTAEVEVASNIRIAVPVATAPAEPARIRTVYTAACIATYGPQIDESIAAGEQARIAPELPLKMNVVGRSQAMVALDRTGLHATLYVRARPLIDALRMLFELVWERATPYPAASQDDALSPQEQRVVTLLATGAKDEAIARQLDVTVRTVRRHIAAAMAKLGAENRFAAGVQATKRGWI